MDLFINSIIRWTISKYLGFIHNIKTYIHLQEKRLLFILNLLTFSKKKQHKIIEFDIFSRQIDTKSQIFSFILFLYNYLVTIIISLVQVKHQDMVQRLNVKLILGNKQGEYALDYEYQDNFAKVHSDSILQLINRFLKDTNYLVKNYLNIWVVTPNGKQHISKLKNNYTTITLAQNQNGEFQMKVVLEDIEEKHNTLEIFHNSFISYVRLINNINKLIDQSKQQERKRGEKNMRPIDIAYFFADPLVTVTKNGIIAKYEVSYQLQYDKFIQLVKKEQFGNNFRIQMKAATKSNIKSILYQGASILHFSCHGKARNGSLQIQTDKQISVGELVDLQAAHFMNLLEVRENILPKLIIFNVCHSSYLASKISSNKRIITIGYNDEAKDIYCQQFTRLFYLGLFKDKKPVRALFDQIKKLIIEKDPQQGKKLQIFPVIPFPDEQKDDFLANTQSKLNFIKKWTFSESMREKDSLGVKCQMFTFIKQYLTIDNRISYVFLKGQKRSGKSDFMKKTRIYVMNRNVFTEDIMIELKDIKGSQNDMGNYIETVLQLRLQKQDFINKKMAQLKELGRDRKTIPLIIFDHAENILKLEYGKFVQYLQSKFMKEIRNGKIVIITNNITPIIKSDAQAFKIAHSHIKAPPNLHIKQLHNYVQRYASQEIKKSAKKMYESRVYPDLKLLKAIKSSKTSKELSELCAIEQQKTRNIYEQINLEYIDDSLKHFEIDIQQLYQCANIKIEENDFIFLSTIYMEIDLQIPQHYANLSCNNQKSTYQIHNLIEKFDIFIKGIFKFFKNQEKYFNQMKKKIPIKSLFHTSLKIAAFIYVYKDCNNLFEKHLLNCEKLYVLISGIYIQELKKNNDLTQTVAIYHLKVLLTLYSFYTQRQQSIKFKRSATGDEKKEQAILHKKSEILVDYIKSEFDKKQFNSLGSTLTSIHVINNIVQQLHYNNQQSLDNSNERNRKDSQVFDSLNDQIDIQEQVGIIDYHNQRIKTYWKNFCIIQANRQKHEKFDFILRPESVILIEILVIKQIAFNLRKIDEIFDSKQSFLSQNITVHLNFYLSIIAKIYSDKIFSKKQKNNLFNYNNSQSIKPLYQQYFKAFIKTYFGLSKARQSLTKQYNLQIFYELIQLCEEFHHISGISSIKKQIQLHVLNQFFNIWTCSTFIAQPLTYQQRGKQVKCNIKRYQSHVYNFLQKFYNTQLDKQVKFQVKLMNQKVLQEYAQAKRILIKLVICDMRQESGKVYLQGFQGRSYPQSLEYLQSFQSQNEKISLLPRAPIVIYFGANVDIIEQYYNKMQTIVIWISVKNFDRKNQQMSVSSQDKKLGIYYTILQYFYCSFCRHFFNERHTLFVQQVKNSFELAKAQAIIRTKILFSSTRQFFYENQIEQAIERIDCNLAYLIVNQQLARKPAYHFIYKQSRKQQEKKKEQPKMELEIVQMKRKKTNEKDKKKRNQNPSFQTDKIYEIGCNVQICYLLRQLERLKQKRQANIIIYYKSQSMLESYLRTLKIKLIKNQIFTMNNVINSNEYKKYRQEMNIQFNQSNLSQIHQISQTGIGSITPFVNIQDSQFQQQIRSMNVVKNSMIRLFFTQKRYNQDKNINILSIEQNYRQIKAQFQYFFIEFKKEKSDATEKQLINKYENVIKKPSASLQDLRKAL